MSDADLLPATVKPPTMDSLRQTVTDHSVTADIQVHVSRPTHGQSAKSGRVAAIDFTKGALVLFMVLYHWLNYFFGNQGDAYKYLRFLTPSFIFITGFVISHVLLSKPAAANILPGKLVRRGLKILALFIILNIVIVVLVPGASVRHLIQTPYSPLKVLSLYALGDVMIPGIGKIASFYILVPIGYLLIASGWLIAASRRIRYVIPTACLFLLLAVAALGRLGIENGALELLAIGFIGEAAGYVSRDRLNQLVGHPYALLCAYVAYMAAITVWGVPLSLRIAGVFLTLILLYLAGSLMTAPGIVRQIVITLGEYSLFGYIVQIAILQALHHLVTPLDGRRAALVALALGTLLTIASVEIVGRLRKQNAIVNAMYKAVFA